MKCPKCREEFTQEDVKKYEDNERLRKEFESIYESKVASLNRWEIKIRKLGTIGLIIGAIFMFIFGGKPIEELTTLEFWSFVGPLLAGCFLWFSAYYFKGKYNSLFTKYKVGR